MKQVARSFLLTDERVRAAMAAGGRSVLLVTFLTALGSVILASVLTYIVTRPLLALREMAQRVAAGDLGSRAHVWSRDEIGLVAMSINQMTDHLVNTQERLTRSNRRLQLTSGLQLPSQHVTIPLEARGQKYGMMNLLCPLDKSISDDDMEILAAIGTEVSERVANAWLQLKLEEKEMARQLLLESLVEAQEDERSCPARELRKATCVMGAFRDKSTFVTSIAKKVTIIKQILLCKTPYNDNVGSVTNLGRTSRHTARKQ